MAGAVGGCGPLHTLRDSWRHHTGVMEWAMPPHPHPNNKNMKAYTQPEYFGPSWLLHKATLFLPCCTISASTTGLLFQGQAEEPSCAPHIREGKSKKKVWRGLPSPPLHYSPCLLLLWKVAVTEKSIYSIRSCSWFLKDHSQPPHPYHHRHPPSFDWYVKSVSLRSSKGSPCVRLKGAHCWGETTLSRNNPVPKEAENVLKKIQALIVYIGEL